MDNQDNMVFEEFINIAESAFPGVIDSERKSRFRQLEGLYRDWNAKINVISRKDIDSIYLHHVLHSLAIARYLQETDPGLFAQMAAPSDRPFTVLDLGTGGGFPGIPLAILLPGCRFTLCDSVGKKVKVLSEVASALGLDNVTVVNARAESLPEVYDFIVSRAVTSLENFLPWVKGKYSRAVLYLKGGDIVQELSNAMKQNRINPASVHTYRIDSWLRDPYFEQKLVISIFF